MLNNYAFLFPAGCGFIGRHLVSYLVDNKLVSDVRVVDKVPPPMAWLNKEHQAIFENPIVEFKSSNLLNPGIVIRKVILLCIHLNLINMLIHQGSRELAFSLDDEASKWDYVINLAAETKPNQTKEVYRQGTVPLSVGCAELAAKQGVKRFVEISTSHCYSAKKVCHIYIF